MCRTLRQGNASFDFKVLNFKTIPLTTGPLPPYVVYGISLDEGLPGNHLYDRVAGDVRGAGSRVGVCVILYAQEASAHKGSSAVI